MKNNMLKAAKHAAYNVDEARWMNRQRIKENACKRKRKLTKRDLECMIQEEYWDDYDQY